MDCEEHPARPASIAANTVPHRILREVVIIAILSRRACGDAGSVAGWQGFASPAVTDVPRIVMAAIIADR